MSSRSTSLRRLFASSWLALSFSAFGEVEPERLSPEDALGGIQRQIELQELDSAIITLDSQVELIEKAKHRYHEDLIQPLVLLGDAHFSKGAFGQAGEYFQRALHLERSNHGLHSVDQVPIVHREVETARALGNYSQANSLEEYAYSIVDKNYSPYDLKRLPSTLRLAKRYLETYNLMAARRFFSIFVQILEANQRDQEPEAIPALRGIASSYRLERFPPFYLDSDDELITPPSLHGNLPELDRPIPSVNNFPAGEQALKQVVTILKSQAESASLESPEDESHSATDVSAELQTDGGELDPQTEGVENNDTVDTQKPPTAELVGAVKDLADWNLLFGRTSIAHSLYAHAYEMSEQLAVAGDINPLTEPELIHFPAPEAPRKPPVRLRGQRQEGYVDVSFDISVEGNLSRVKVIESRPDGLMDFRVRRSMRAARYRPALIDGIPQATKDYKYHYMFPYYPRLKGDEDDPVAVTDDDVELADSPEKNQLEHRDDG